jgi:hypothetical protein
VASPPDWDEARQDRSRSNRRMQRFGPSEVVGDRAREKISRGALRFSAWEVEAKSNQCAAGIHNRGAAR